MVVELEGGVELLVLVVEIAFGLDVVEHEEGVPEVGVAHLVDAFVVHERLLEVDRVLGKLLPLGQELRSSLLAPVLENEIVARFVAQVISKLECLVVRLNQLYSLACSSYSSS